MRSLTSRGFLLGFALCSSLLASANVARADKVLVYQRQNMENAGADEAGPKVAELLEALDHDVTREISMTAALPTDLSGFDSVWVVQVVETTGVEQTRLVEYVRAGGGLYLTGENHGCCAGLKSSIQYIVNQLIPDITNLSNAGNMGEEWVAAADTWGITTTPNDIPVWLTRDTGSMSKIPDRNQVYKDSAGDKVGMAAWTGEYLKKAGGCLFVSMDLSYWLDAIHPEIDKAPFVENVQTFLGTCADSDHDGVTDMGEEEAGTDPESPDSDGDGLCDGYRTVPGVCLSGESVFDNTDGDELANPLDTDDDGDTIPTSFELEAELVAPDADEYNDPAWIDIDSDNNNILDAVEGFTDHDGDGIPSIVDLDDNPDNCDEDADCDVQPGSLGCNDDTGFCEFPRPTGNEPIGGRPGSDGGSPSSAGGAPGEAGGDDGGTPRGGRSNGGGTRGNAEAGNDGDSEGSASSNDTGGCACSVPVRSTSPGLALSLLALMIARRKLRARARAAS